MDTIADFYQDCFAFVLGLSGGFILGNWGKIFNWWLDWVCGKEEDRMIDKLVEYKQLIEKHRRGLAIYWIDTDKEITADVVFDWLISELEKCRAENEMFQGDVVRLQQTNRRLNRRCTEMEGALKKAEAEVRRLKSILANQGTEF